MKYLLRNRLFGFVILCLCLYGCFDSHQSQLKKMLITDDEVEVTGIPPELIEIYKVHPHAYNCLTYYTKYIDAEGIAIVGSDWVRDEQFYAAREIVLLMTSKRPELREPLSLKTGFRIILLSADEPPDSEYEIERGVATIPEQPNFWSTGWYNSSYAVATVWWQHRFKPDPDKIEMKQHVLIHEVAHAIHLKALSKLDPTFDERLLAAYEYALENPDSSVESAGSFGLKNHAEYWAEQVKDWHGKTPYTIKHRYKVRKKDQLLLPLIEEWLPKIYLRPLDDVLNAPSRRPVEWDWYSPETDAHWHRETYPGAYEDGQE